MPEMNTAEDMLAEMVKDVRRDLQHYTRERVRHAVTMANCNTVIREQDPHPIAELLAVALIQLAEGQTT